MSDATSSSFPHRPAIALVGNPGAGKSTLLNGLAGSPQFRSGLSLVEGLTKVLQAFPVGNLTLYDTPGLFDITRSKRAGKELDKLLSENVALRIAFVVTLDEGRVRRADTLTIKLVLDAISVDTNDRFGVIINKMGKGVEAILREDPETECRLQKKLTGDRKTSYWCYVPMENSLQGAKDKCHTTSALHLLLHGLPVTKPLYTVVSSVETQNLEKLLEAEERRVSEIENAKGEEFREMMADYELQNIDAEKRISALERTLHEHELKNAQRPKEVQNIEEEKREESAAHDLDVPFKVIEQDRYAEDDGEGVLADPVRKVVRYNQAIEKGGDVKAKYTLALLYTVGSSVETQNLEKLLEAAERHVSEIENARGEEFREMMADYELQNIDAEKRISALERTLHEHELKNAQRPKEVQNIEEEKREESVAHDLDVPFKVIEQDRYAEDDGDEVRGDPFREVARYNRAIEKRGDAKAMYNLALLLKNGAHGVPADPVRAVELLNRAIDKGGHVDAMVHLAFLLAHGADGAPIDPVRAAELYNRAIEKDGDVSAMQFLQLSCAIQPSKKVEM